MTSIQETALEKPPPHPHAYRHYKLISWYYHYCHCKSHHLVPPSYILNWASKHKLAFLHFSTPGCIGLT